MRKSLHRCLSSSLILLLFLTALVPAQAAAAPEPPISVPIVFTARNHLDTHDGTHVGPPVEVSAREKAVGGKLMVRYPDGEVVDLTSSLLFDVSRPTVSFDGTRIVFSGVKTAKSQWHIYEIKLDGSDFRQMTYDDRSLLIPTNPREPTQNKALFNRYGDFSPAYLPDGRIIFSSSRYPSLSGSCGQRALNLYVVNGDGSNMHRITTERAGAIDPYVLASGKVVFSHWVDNMNVPAFAGSGLQPLAVERNFSSSFWIFWATNPDGTEAGRYAFNGGKFKDKGGVFQPREMPDGRIVYTYRTGGSLLGSTLPTGISLLTPGAGDGNDIKGIGDPTELDGAHALSPTPLPDGRILFSYTPTSSVSVDSKGRTVAQFNYGLYVTDDKFQNISLVYDGLSTDELDAVAVYPRTAKVIPDVPDASLISDDPGADLGTKVVLKNSNIYADLPLDFREIVSPLAGSIVAVDFYDDSQTFSTSEDFPLVRKQPPKFVGSVPVTPDGSFTATIPADKPIFWLLRNASGVVARSLTSPQGESFTSFVPTHDYFRPNTEARCIGCHRGHMINFPLTLKEAKTNLARLATATASSSLDSYNSAPWRINDNKLVDDKGRYSWASNGETTPWVQLNWLAPVDIDEVVLYPRTHGGNRIDKAMLYFSDGSNVPVNTPLMGISGIKVSFPTRKVFWLRFQVESGQGPSLGLADLGVHGSQVVEIPPVPPAAPRSLKVTLGSILLTWERSPEPYIGGYRIYYGTSPGKYTDMANVGNVNRYLMTDLEDGVTYYFSIRAYTLNDKESAGFSNEVKATFFAPKIESISAASGPIGGDTKVTITGSHFSNQGIIVLFGGSHAKITSKSPTSLEVLTPKHGAGVVDVAVINADGSRHELKQGFTYVK